MKSYFLGVPCDLRGVTRKSLDVGVATPDGFGVLLRFNASSRLTVLSRPFAGVELKADAERPTRWSSMLFTLIFDARHVDNASSIVTSAVEFMEEEEEEPTSRQDTIFSALTMRINAAKLANDVEDDDEEAP